MRWLIRFLAILSLMLVLVPSVSWATAVSFLSGFVYSGNATSQAVTSSISPSPGQVIALTVLEQTTPYVTPTPSFSPATGGAVAVTLSPCPGAAAQGIFPMYIVVPSSGWGQHAFMTIQFSATMKYVVSGAIFANASNTTPASNCIATSFPAAQYTPSVANTVTYQSAQPFGAAQSNSQNRCTGGAGTCRLPVGPSAAIRHQRSSVIANTTTRKGYSRTRVASSIRRQRPVRRST